MSEVGHEQSGSALDYRGFWTTSAPAGWAATVEKLAGEWLSPKMRAAIDLTLDQTVGPSDGKLLQVLHHTTQTRRAVRAVLDEDNTGGHFTTTLTAVEEVTGGGWVSLDVTSAAGGFVNRPKLAVQLLDALPLRDGQVISAQVQRVRGGHGELVLDAIRDAARLRPVLVAATDERLPFEAFASMVDDIARELAGIAHVFVLDTETTVAFNRVLHPRWRTPEWTIRTYQPGIDLNDPAGARSSRILGTDRLGNDRDGYLRRLLGTVVRDAVGRRPAPGPWREWQRTFMRLATDALTSAARPALPHHPPVRPLTPGMDELDRVRTTLGLADLSESSLLDLLDRATGVDPAVLARTTERMLVFQGRVEQLEDRLEEAQIAVLIAEDERDKADAARGDLERRVRYLTTALVRAGRADLAYGHTPEDEEIDDLGEEPLTFDELAARLGDFERRGVVFTGDVKKMTELAYLDVDGKILQATWEAFVTLTEYLRAKGSPDGFDGSVHKFLEEQPTGYRCYPVTRHASTETGWTKTQYKGARSFPVPVEVNRAGRADMFEHFKLGRAQRKDPRMHYLDDTVGTGKVYVGYVGPHLVNSMTET